MKRNSVPYFNPKPTSLNTKLIAIWAVSESGLGGLLHAAKIPFSGIILGSFAVIIVTFIAKSNSNRFNAVVKATMLVILIKAMVSPHSPPMAYVAVLFQGILGASIYGALGVNKLTAMSLGALALLESAFQKILTLTIIFGMNIWESIQRFFDGIHKQLQIEWIADLPWMFLGLYGIIYFTVGLLAGSFAIKLPEIVLKNAESLRNKNLKITPKGIPLKKRKRKRLWLIVGLLVFSILVFLYSGMPDQAIIIVLRTTAAVVFFLFLFNPIFKYMIQKWTQKRKQTNQDTLNTIIDLMPEIKNNVGLAQQLSFNEKNTIKRFKLFIIHWLSLSLYFPNNNNE